MLILNFRSQLEKMYRTNPQIAKITALTSSALSSLFSNCLSLADRFGSFRYLTACDINNCKLFSITNNISDLIWTKEDTVYQSYEKKSYATTIFNIISNETYFLIGTGSGSAFLDGDIFGSI